jgi:hypothetical protein
VTNGEIRNVEDANLRFPVIWMASDVSEIRMTLDILTDSRSSIVRSGVYDRSTIVDATGRTFRVVDYQIVGSIGPLWGYAEFASRRVRLQIMVREEGDAEIEKVRKIVLGQIRSFAGWRSRDDYDSLVKDIREAQSVPELMSRLIEHKA